MRLKRYALYALIVVNSACSGQAPDTVTSATMGVADDFSPLSPHTGSDPLCGVQTYNGREDAACGVALWKEARSPECGVELYNQRADMSCDGSITEDTRIVTSSGDCRKAADEPESCPAGYHQIDYKSDSSDCISLASAAAGRGATMHYNMVVQRQRVCRRDAVAAVCRKPAFGVESYLACRDPSHGVERYNSCQRPEFGVAAYNSCTYYLSPQAAAQYIDSHARLVEFMDQQLLTGAAQFFAITANETGLACVIAKYDGDPIYADAIEEMKGVYVATFGDGYRDTSCDPSIVLESSIDHVSCSDSDSSSKCRNYRSYYGARKWLEATREDIHHLLDDHIAQSGGDIHEQLTQLQSNIDRALKPFEQAH